ncbi:phasin family protein [Oleisolibacter albus]|uniref:phasin family protein n=1 Tax=Oleisolibacter albus TaxID=2171757 RepID=UPI000DF3C61D|nr:phasin family protein [Oleisolibacter albus]
MVARTKAVKVVAEPVAAAQAPVAEDVTAGAGAAESAAPIADTLAPPAASAIPAAPVQSVEQVLTYTQEQVEKMSAQIFNAYGDVAGFHKDNIDALVQSSAVLVKGLEALSKAVSSYTQAQLDQGMSAAKAALSVKTLKELVDLQTEYARSSFDAFMAEATKVSELSVQVANEAAEPLTARINATVEQLGKLKAA